MKKENKRRLKHLLSIWGDCDRIQKMQAIYADECEIVDIKTLQNRAGAGTSYHLSVQCELEEIINKMPYDMQAVLRARYKKNIIWECIPINLPFNISLRQCYRLHSQAMEIISEELKAKEEGCLLKSGS